MLRDLEATCVSHLFCHCDRIPEKANKKSHGFRGFSPFLAGSLISEHGVMQCIVVQSVVEQICSPHGIWETERTGPGTRLSPQGCTPKDPLPSANSHPPPILYTIYVYIDHFQHGKVSAWFLLEYSLILGMDSVYNTLPNYQLWT